MYQVLLGLPAAVTLCLGWVETFSYHDDSFVTVQLTVYSFVFADETQVVFKLLRKLPARGVGDIAENTDLRTTAVVEDDWNRTHPMVILRNRFVFHPEDERSAQYPYVYGHDCFLLKSEFEVARVDAVEPTIPRGCLECGR